MKKLAAIILTALSLVIAVVSLRYFLLPDTAPLLKLKEGAYRVSLLMHAAGGLVALAGAFVAYKVGSSGFEASL